MQAFHVLARPLVTALVAALLLVAVAPGLPVEMGGPITVHASEATHPVDGAHAFALPAGTTHVAIHWLGHHDAQLSAAFSPDGTTYPDPQPVAHDEVGELRGDGRTYGAVMTATDARWVRVTADEPLPAVTVVAMDAGAEVGVRLGTGARVAGVTPQPTVITRSGWGADESIRFDRLGDERWYRAYFPLQKLVVHHTAGSNTDTNPAATVRAIYHYHAVTQDWGDIGYQYLIDSAGRVYEGRFSRDYWNGANPTADDGSGLIVQGGHARQHNAGTMGIALLGTFTTVQPTTAARASLVRMLAWASAAHGINPTGSSTYVNPVTGLTRTTPNIGGHRNYNSTGCPGGALYALLPTIRSQVSAQVNAWPGAVYNPPRTVTFAAGTYVGRQFTPAGAITASRPYTLTRTSSAPTSQRATVPGQPGYWYYITAGVWAGYWVPESAATTLGPERIPPTVEAFTPSRPLTLAPGTYVGRRFSSTGAVLASRTATLAQASVAWTNQRATIPNQAGTWFYVTAGTWAGYWIGESASTTLGDPPPPPPAPLAIYDPPRTLNFSPGTYVGYQFNAYGMAAKTKSYTLPAASSAPTSRLSTIVNQAGTWYYVTAGVWAGMWVAESPSVTLADP